MTREIPLTRGLVAMVDDADFERVSAFKWIALYSRGIMYAHCRSVGLMHRFILSAPRGMVVDHANRDGLNNTRANIRVCTQSENCFNRVKSGGRTSKFKGVHRTSGGKWAVQVHFRGKRTHYETFATEIAAALAYDVIAKKTHGDFARLNFPEAAQ